MERKRRKEVGRKKYTKIPKRERIRAEEKVADAEEDEPISSRRRVGAPWRTIQSHAAAASPAPVREAIIRSRLHTCVRACVNYGCA